MSLLGDNTPHGPNAGFPAPGGPPPGWYPDPAGTPMQRYFNGTQWTDQLAPQPAPPLGQPSGNRTLAVVMSLVAVVAFAGVIGLSYYSAHRDAVATEHCLVRGTQPLTLDKKHSDEPTIVVAAAPGWELMTRSDFPLTAKELDSPLIRGIIVNNDLRENGFIPNAVVTAEKYTESSPTLGEKAAHAEARQLAKMSTAKPPAALWMCGNEFYQIDFTGLESSSDGGKQTGMELVTAVDGQDGDRWVVTLTLQTRNPDNPGYKAQRDALLRGFSVEPPPLKK